MKLSYNQKFVKWLWSKNLSITLSLTLTFFPAEQQLLDCAYSPPDVNGCDGAGLYNYANYATKNKMIHENTYPYTSGSTRNVGYCKTMAYWNPGAKVVEKIVHHVPTDEQIKKLVKTYGHAIVAMYAGSPGENSFKHYKTGVYDGCR